MILTRSLGLTTLPLWPSACTIETSSRLVTWEFTSNTWRSQKSVFWPSKFRMKKLVFTGWDHGTFSAEITIRSRNAVRMIPNLSRQKKPRISLLLIWYGVISQISYLSKSNQIKSKSLMIKSMRIRSRLTSCSSQTYKITCSMPNGSGHSLCWLSSWRSSRLLLSVRKASMLCLKDRISH